MSRTKDLGTVARFLPLMLAAGLAAACNDSVGVVDYYDPSTTLDQLEDVLYPMESSTDLLLGLDLAIATVDYYGADGLAAMLSLRPERKGSVLDAGRRARALRERRVGAASAEGAAMAGGDLAAFTLPPYLEGETLAWDDRDGYVISGWSGAPHDGVRFILYRMDPDTGYPSRPLIEVGYLDITDEDDDLTEGTRVLAVREAGSDRVVADYVVWLDVSGTYEEGDMELGVTGTLGDEVVVDIAMLQQLTWSWSRDLDELYMDYHFSQGSRSVELDGWATSRYEAQEWADFEFQVGFHGGVDRVDIDAAVRETGRLEGDIRYEGQRVVRVRGTESSPRFEATDGGALDRRDENTFLDIWTGIADLIWYADWVLAPGDLLLAAG